MALIIICISNNNKKIIIGKNQAPPFYKTQDVIKTFYLIF